MGSSSARLLASIPLDVQREGLSLTALQASLKGRSGRCSSAELGMALRKLHFYRKRKWHNAGGFQARWHRKITECGAA
jgi:hypothetical protein